MRVSLFQNIIPSIIRVPLAILSRKLGLSKAIQSALCVSECKKLAREFKGSGRNHRKSKVLIICAHYNHLKWLAGCIDSVLAQTHTNFQLIIVDDFSSDEGVCEGLAAQAARDPRIKAIFLKENTGAYVARNTGFNAADSDWTHVTFIDPDDLAFPNWLEHCLNVLDGREGSVRPVLQRWTEDFSKMKSIYFGYCQSLHSRYAYERAGGFLPVRVSGDVELILRLSLLTKDNKTILKKSFKPAQKLRLHDASASQKSLNARKIWIESREKELEGTPSNMLHEIPVTSVWREYNL
tara:strand:- start:3276 stop:4157 length:882 start_codon:yes stop_codon:yes gene_type:complete